MILASIVGGITAFLAIRLYRRYRREIRASQNRVLEGSRIVETHKGPVEYAITGSGPAVLVIHGIGGGYDQGLYLGQLGAEGFRLISISRFGYLGTPLPREATPAAQADAIAALLDALGIAEVAIVGISAGGPSSLQFAMRHPERCAALVMVSAVNYAVPAHFLNLAGWFKRTYRSDFLGWLLIRQFRWILLSIFGIAGRALKRITPAQKQWIDRAFEIMLPVRWRAEGIVNDLEQIASLDRLPLESIKAPTLVVHAKDDKIVLVDQGRYSAAQIKGARYVELESGGHFLLGQHQKVREEIAKFLKENLVN